MRIPKYQAWNKKLNRMQPVLEIVLDPETGGVIVYGKATVDFLTGEHEAQEDFWSWDDIELREYVITNKFHQEIYAGDIVHYEVFNLQGVVTWIDTAPGFIIIHQDRTGASVLHDEWEVIGNVWEHPEMVEKRGKDEQA